MKLLITGSKGQLGKELMRRAENHKVLGLDLPDLDITDSDQIQDIIDKFQPDIIINSAAYTQVDKAENDQKTAFRVNVIGPENLAKACHSHNIPLVHISTDFVFDGQKSTPYLETDLLNPLSVYGRTKAEGEAAIKKYLKKHFIIRTAWLYSPHGNNFVKTMIRLGKERETLGVVADQYGCPTSAADLAQAILTILSQIKHGNYWGIYHYCGAGITTWHEFAQTILDEVRKYAPIQVQKINAITTADYPTPAARPPYSALDCTKIQKTFGILPKPWQESLAQCILSIFKFSPRS